MLTPLIQLSIWGRPNQVGLLISAILSSVLLGSEGAIYSGQLRWNIFGNLVYFLLLIAERIFPRNPTVSRGAHLNEGNAININITAGVIVHINSIKVP